MHRLRPYFRFVLPLLAGLNVAHASGFALSELSVAGLSEADALIANTHTQGAFAYNPAAMAFHKGGYDIGIIGIDSHTTVAPAGENQTVTATTATWQTMPNLFWSHTLTHHFRFGVGINEPYGLQISWPANTFPPLASGPAAALAPTDTNLRLLNLNPNIAYRWGQIAADVGIDYYYAQSVTSETPTTDFGGNGSALGANLGLLARIGAINIGATYRSAVNVPINGTLTQGTPEPASANLHLPWQTGLGIHDRLSKRIGIEFDVDRTGWSRFTNFIITPTGGSTAPITSTNDWSAANAYRIGVHYRLSRHVALRAGYAYDVTGQNTDYFSARIPDANRQILSFGATQQIGRWSLSAGYMYVHFNTRTITSDTPLTTADPNGTIAYNGTYRTHAELFGISITRRFS